MIYTVPLTAQDYQKLARNAERWAPILDVARQYELADFYRADASKYAELAAGRLPSIREEIAA